MVRAELLWLVSVAAYLISRRFFVLKLTTQMAVLKA
jgi:hypothetical protein